MLIFFTNHDLQYIKQKTDLMRVFCNTYCNSGEKAQKRLSNLNLVLECPDAADAICGS